MKTKILKFSTIAVILLLIFSASSIAQRGERMQQRKAEIEMRRIAFYNRFLNLTPAEAEKFWPLFNEYAKKRAEIKKDIIKNKKSYEDENFDQLNEKEADEAIKNDVEVQQKMFDLNKEYIAKFKIILPVQKVAKLRKAEQKFRKELLKMVRDKRKYNMR